MNVPPLTVPDRLSCTVSLGPAPMSSVALELVPASTKRPLPDSMAVLIPPPPFKILMPLPPLRKSLPLPPNKRLLPATPSSVKPPSVNAEASSTLLPAPPVSMAWLMPDRVSTWGAATGRVKVSEVLVRV